MFPDLKYSLLYPSDDTELITDSYTPGHMSYKFTSGEPAQVLSYVNRDLVGLNLSTPFIVTAIFKLYSVRTSCLFGITQNDVSVMKLCIKPAGRDISRVSLNTDLFSPSDSISFLLNENFKDKWIKMIVYVKNDTADLYLNCIKQPYVATLTKGADVVLTEDMRIHLAVSAGPRVMFEVSDSIFYLTIR